jgi:hypothetical protein
MNLFINEHNTGELNLEEYIWQSKESTLYTS